jgi:hypothetical protein
MERLEAMCPRLVENEEYARRKNKIARLQEEMREIAIGVIDDWASDGTRIFTARLIVDLTIEVDNLR